MREGTSMRSEKGPENSAASWDRCCRERGEGRSDRGAVERPCDPGCFPRALDRTRIKSESPPMSPKLSNEGSQEEPEGGAKGQTPVPSALPAPPYCGCNSSVCCWELRENPVCLSDLGQVPSPGSPGLRVG